MLDERQYEQLKELLIFQGLIISSSTYSDIGDSNPLT